MSSVPPHTHKQSSETGTPENLSPAPQRREKLGTGVDHWAGRGEIVFSVERAVETEETVKKAKKASGTMSLRR